MTNPKPQQRRNHNWLAGGPACCPARLLPCCSFAVEYAALMAGSGRRSKRFSPTMKPGFEPLVRAAQLARFERPASFPARQPLGAGVIGATVIRFYRGPQRRQEPDRFVLQVHVLQAKDFEPSAL